MAPRIAIVHLLVIFSVGARAAPTPSTAWDRLEQAHPSLAASATPLERLVLQGLTPMALARYQGGVPASEVFLHSGESLEHFLERSAGGVFNLSWLSVDGGGSESIGGDFSLSGTIGQHDAGTSSGGVFRVTGGFWAVTADSSKLFCDGFESGTTHQWSFVFGE